NPRRLRLHLGVGDQPPLPINQTAGDRRRHDGSAQDDHRRRIAERHAAMSAGAVTFGLDDAALATRATKFSADAYAGQVALVSGGAGGIGRGVAWLLARLGAHVVVAGRNEAKLAALVEARSARGLLASYEI